MQKSHGSTFPAATPLLPPTPPSPRSQPDPRVHPVFAEASKWSWISTACRGFDDDTPLKRQTGARAPLADKLVQWDFDTANCGWVSSLGALKSPCGCLALCPESRCGRFIHSNPPGWLADSQLNTDSRRWHTSKSVLGIRSVPCVLAELRTNQLQKCHRIIFFIESLHAPVKAELSYCSYSLWPPLLRSFVQVYMSIQIKQQHASEK